MRRERSPEMLGLLRVGVGGFWTSSPDWQLTSQVVEARPAYARPRAAQLAVNAPTST